MAWLYRVLTDRQTTSVSAAQRVGGCEQGDVKCRCGEECNHQAEAVVLGNWAAGEPACRRRGEKLGSPSVRLLREDGEGQPGWCETADGSAARVASSSSACNRQGLRGEGAVGEGGEVKRRDAEAAGWQCAGGCPAVAV
jgi:hypothetical protein